MVSVLFAISSAEMSGYVEEGCFLRPWWLPKWFGLCPAPFHFSGFERQPLPRRWLVRHQTWQFLVVQCVLDLQLVHLARRSCKLDFFEKFFPAFHTVGGWSYKSPVVVSNAVFGRFALSAKSSEGSVERLVFLFWSGFFKVSRRLIPVCFAFFFEVFSNIPVKLSISVVVDQFDTFPFVHKVKTIIGYPRLCSVADGWTLWLSAVHDGVCDLLLYLVNVFRSR